MKRGLFFIAVALTASTALAQPTAQGVRVVEGEGPALGGFDLALTTYDSSGVYFAPEGYTNTLSLWLEPSFAIGRRFARGTWWEPLRFSVRFMTDFELSGSDPRFRGRSFQNPMFAPEQVPVDRANAPPPGVVDGPQHMGASISDLWLLLGHGHLWTVPGARVSISTMLRGLVPVSQSSRNSGLVTALSATFFFERIFGPVALGYAVRPTKWFFTRTVPELQGPSDPVLVNGRLEQPYRPISSGIANPDWGVMHGPSLDVQLPWELGLSVMYLLFHVAPYRSGTCTVDGVYGADLCSDGVAVNRADPGAMRVDHWFLAAIRKPTPFVNVSLGLSTWRPFNNRDGSVSQPFFSSTRDNLTTVYFSLDTSVSQVLGALRPPEKK